ncbi:MAG: hypothetical protein AAGD28_13850 [Bacteroidota bacterium]
MNAKNLIKGTLIGTLVLFFWGATEWINPLPRMVYKSPKSSEAVNKVLMENMEESGMYIWPNGPETRNEAGNPEGVMYFMAKQSPDFYNPGKFMSGQLVINLSLWFLLSFLILKSNLKGYWQRVGFVMIIALIASLSYLIPMWNWWGFSTPYLLLTLLNMLIGWFLAASAVSWALRNSFEPVVEPQVAFA